MFCGTRDLLVPGCRLLTRRAAEAGWPLTYIEQRDLIHAFPMLPFLPEARVAFQQTVDFLR
jgi:acetyl esterase/lipase